MSMKKVHRNISGNSDTVCETETAKISVSDEEYLMLFEQWSRNIDAVRETAKLLDAYIQFRAKHEGVGYELDPEFFEKRIRWGISKFFGVSFIDGKSVSDEEFPMLFEQWNGETQRDLH